MLGKMGAEKPLAMRGKASKEGRAHLHGCLGEGAAAHAGSGCNAGPSRILDDSR